MALMHVECFSSVLGMCVPFDAIIPEQAVGQIGMDSVRSDTYPTLYLLHGMSDDHTIWQRHTSIERYAAEKGLAVIMPEVGLSWYTNTAYGYRYFDYISRELPAICRGFFKGMSAKREDTFAAGNSMGGYGALKLGLAASGTFGAVASLSGGLDLADMVKIIPENRWIYNGFLGGNAEKIGEENDLFALAGKLKKSGKPQPKIYQWCGKSDFLYQQNIRMRDYLRQLGYDLTYEESPGDHAWKYWDEKIQDVLNWLPIQANRKK